MRLLKLTDTASLRGVLLEGIFYWSVYDFITFICDRQMDTPLYAQRIFSRLLEKESRHREELLSVAHKLKLSKATTPTYVMNVQGLCSLLNILGAKVSVSQREVVLTHFGQIDTDMNDIPTVEKLVDSGTLRAITDIRGMQFFSVYDFIQCVCGKQASSYGRNLLRRLLEDGSEHREALSHDMIYVHFEGQGQRQTPCLGKNGLVRLCSVLGSKLNPRYVGMVEVDMMLC